MLARNISRYGWPILFLVFSFSGPTALPALEKPPVNYLPVYPFAQVTSLIRDRLVDFQNHPPELPGNEKIFSPGTLEIFYRQRDYQPAWSGRNRLSDAAAMIRAIRKSRYGGLIPANYHLKEIEDLFGMAHNVSSKAPHVNPQRMADLDLLLSDSFFTLASHLSAGCVDPVTLQPRWSFHPNADLANVLTNALDDHRIAGSLRELSPGTSGYAALRKALARYRELAEKDAQPPIPGGRLLKEGMTSPRVIRIREKLFFLGDLDRRSDRKREFFDKALQQAVVKFQERHGLKDDGIVGPNTIGELNVPISERLKQLVVNLERMRWSDGGRGNRYLIVNIADFELEVVENKNVVLSMKVVVGKPYLDTPVFRGKMTYMVLNPVWNIPASIAKKEILPKVKKDPDYLKEENIAVLRGWGNSEEGIDPATINWRSLNGRNLDFRFRQEPGPLNPLGRIKFMFPNKFNVYLHDTPVRNLFSENVRTFSHGCIRIEKPLELAEYLLKDDTDWTKEDIDLALEDGETLEVRLPQPLYVYVNYITAWVNKDGSAEFRKDIYGRDAYLYEAITRNPRLR